MSRKSILITGTSSGIGRDAAGTLAERGWLVFAACRAGEDVSNVPDGCIGVHLDYEDAETIGAALDVVLSHTDGRLDAVFNNGAYAIPAPLEDVSRDAMSAIFQANFIGWHDLTRRLVPIMRHQGGGRIVNCSSVLGLVAAPYRGAYNATKFALEGWSDTLRQEVADDGIDVILIEPGPIDTPFRANAVAQFERWVDWESSDIAPRYRDNLLDKLYKGSTQNPFQLPASAVTRKLIRALDAPRPKPRYFVTRPTYIANIARRILPTRALDRMTRRF